MDTTLKDLPLHGQINSVDILAETRVWRKIGEKHMTEPREPWDEWMGAGLVAEFKTLWPLGCQNDNQRKTVLDVSEHVQKDALVSLRAPLLMKYVYRRINNSNADSGTQGIRTVEGPEPTQRLVLPNGARAEIRQGNRGDWTLRTCYFDRDVAGRGSPLWLRYRRLVRKLRVRYVRAPGNSEPEIVDPYLKDDSIETGIEFVSPHNWGLEASVPVDPWNHLPEPWPQLPAPPAAPPSGLLRPRPGGATI